MTDQSTIVDCGKDIHEKKLLEMARSVIERAQRHADRPTSGIRKYLVLSTPRVGSTLLARRLEETGQLGRPEEWFNPEFINAILKVMDRDILDIDQYVDMILRATATPNGIFGVNIHVHQYTHLLSQNMDLLKIGFEHIYWLQRRDKIKQAYSWCKGFKTQCWSKSHEREAGFPDGINVDIKAREVAEFLQYICKDREFFENEIRPKVRVDRELFYLDIVADRCFSAVNSILGDFGLDPVELAPEMQMKPQTNPFDQEQILKIKHFFGLAV